MPTVMIVDDDYLVREGARSVLSSLEGFEVIGLAGEPQELFGLLEKQRPDAVVLDIRMPPTYHTEGIEAAHQIREKYPKVGVVIVSQYADPEYALQLLRHGSAGFSYLLKERLADRRQLAEAIVEAAEGRSLLDSKVVDGLLQAQRRRSRSRLRGLTEREHEVLSHMAAGRNNASIAKTLVLTEHAVEKHINSIFRKLGLNEELDINQRVAAVLFFLQHDLG